ncbi:MAG: PSD1 and planctomycete cytochrome C domain-containing protein [Fuerstiella sp.]
MNVTERCDLLLQKHLTGELSPSEVDELRGILKSDSSALDRYLDLCELDEQLMSLSPDVGRTAVARLTGTRTHSSPGQSSIAVAVAVCMILVVGVAVQQQRTDSGTPVVASIDRDLSTGHSGQSLTPSQGRNRNPWKVINSIGSMNHPGLTEVSVPAVTSASTRKIKFNRDIRPILSETCFHCHGPDEHGRRADLRFDTIEGATADLGGYQPITPGDLANSEAWNRISSDDPDLLMPPPESHLVLTEEQKTLLRRWIEEGAEYEGHWAFASPATPELPTVDFTDEKTQAKWVRNAIDSLVAQRLVEAGMTPSIEADARTLIRRLSLDLSGLPPTIDQTAAFISDYELRGEAAYHDTVARLLKSPHFGERMALPWLDQARYADTNGYSIDGGRDMWLWRDWVIQAYNDNKPFDQFVTEQLAGDLLSDATDAQRIATGFNRNHMITHEGGTIPAENLTNYAADRVKTTAEVFLGLTMGCAQCHDHKYDPISQKEYYQFFAFFNELGDQGLAGNGGKNAAPAMSAVTVLQTEELSGLDTELQQLRDRLSQSTDGFDAWLAAQRAEEDSLGDGFRFISAQMLDVSSPNRPGPFQFEPDGTVTLSRPAGGLNGFSHSLRVSSDERSEQELVSGLRIEFLPKASDKEAKPALTRFADGVPKVATVLVSGTAQPADQVDYHQQVSFAKVTASSQADGHPATSLSDERNLQWWQPSRGDVTQHLTLTFSQPLDPQETPYLSVLVFFGQSKSLPFEWRIRPFAGQDTDSRWGAAVASAILRPTVDWDDQTREQVLAAFRRTAVSLEPLRVRINNLEERRTVLTTKHSTLVMNTAAKPRETFVLNRGQYDDPTERVSAQTPGVLPVIFNNTSETEAAELNRLDLANWLVAPGHPLTSRVAVNRIWKIFFGTGIVATSADFGSQGEYPSHPELLDYLATHFVQSGWDQKRLIREIVSSATYRQQSIATANQIELDPRNRLLARGPRFRLPAELIRDQTLAVSGLLVRRIGGPSMHPYQPPGLWKEISHFGSTPATKQVFVQDHGEKLYRRSLYTIVKRTSPHPAMAAFDAPNREMCTVDRGVTNTPIQALVTLNDPQFAEAARVFAAWLLTDEAATDDQSRIKRAFEKVVCRIPSDRELNAVASLLQSERKRYRSHPQAAAEAVSVGEWPQSEDIDAVEQAAWTQVAALLLNLSETLTRT